MDFINVSSRQKTKNKTKNKQPQQKTKNKKQQKQKQQKQKQNKKQTNKQTNKKLKMDFSRFGVLFAFLSVFIFTTPSNCKLTSISYCYQVASQFANSCPSAPYSPASSVESMTGRSVTCSNVGVCAGTPNGNTCTWQQKLCVSCREDSLGRTLIRVQTNGLPLHCYSTPRQKPNSLDVDFEVLFNLDVEIGQDEKPIPR